MMKLYYSKGACSLVIRIVIHELQLNAEFCAVNLQTKQTENNEDFLKINPKGAVPTLMLDNKEILTENSVIQQYLADNYKGTQLLPAINDFKRYRVLEWLNYVSTELHKGCVPLFNAKVPEDIKDAIFKPALKAKINYVEKHLAQYEYLLGDQFTFPDAYLFVVLRWMPYLKIDLSDCPAITRYFENLKERQSIKQSLTEEGIQ
jgi:glutathione S-transferase